MRPLRPNKLVYLQNEVFEAQLRYGAAEDPHPLHCCSPPTCKRILSSVQRTTAMLRTQYDYDSLWTFRRTSSTRSAARPSQRDGTEASFQLPLKMLHRQE